MTICIVEDEPGVRNCLRAFIEARGAKLGVKVTMLEASNFPEARDLVAEADTVLCDGNFPLGLGVGVKGSPWIYVYSLCRPRLMLYLQRFALMTGDDDCAQQAEAEFHLTVFQKPFKCSVVMDWIFQESRGCSAEVSRSERDSSAALSAGRM